MASMPSLIYQRTTGKSRSVVFRDEVAVHKSQLELLDDPQVASPHGNAIPALQVDRVEGRFLLSGSSDATVCIYDLSKWGTDEVLSGKTSPARSNVYKPVARSVRVPFSDELETPHGHSHSVEDIQWYPVDTGAFVSASVDGSLLVWDTHAMEPVVRWNPLPSISCMDLSTSQGRSDSLLAVGSLDDDSMRLVDIRSGASSHLLGNEGGITCLQWSPLSDVVVASGSVDGTIRLWDIRKPGSRSCITVLDRDQQGTKSGPFRSSYSHLAAPFEASPNNYHKSKRKGIISHEGSISALSFTSDGSRLVSTGNDGKLKIWNLLGSGNALPLNFSFKANLPAISRLQTRIPIVLQDCGKRTTAWVGHGSEIVGYDIDKGGRPIQILNGHMHTVTSLERVSHSMQIFSGAMDGMILAWGSSPETSKRRKANVNAGALRKRIREVAGEDSGELRDTDAW